MNHQRIHRFCLALMLAAMLVRLAGQVQHADGVAAVVRGNIIKMPAQPVPEHIRVGGPHGLARQLAAVSRSIQNGFVAVLAAHAGLLHPVKHIAAFGHKILQPGRAARHELAAKVGQHMGSALRPKFIIGVGDAGRHGLAGHMGHLIQQHRFRGFAPDILIAALGKGIGIQHQVVFVMLGFEQILHGAQLVIRQGPV